MVTSVPSKNDLDKLLAKDAAFELALTGMDKLIHELFDRVEALETAKTPPAEPPVIDPPPVVVPPEPESSGAIIGPYTNMRDVPFPAPVVTPQQLVDQKIMFAFDRSLVMGDRTSVPAVALNRTVAGAFDSVRLTKFMPGTGEREDIGLVTDAQAEFMMDGSAGVMMAQAEAHGSVPIHALIDGRFIDVYKNPLSTFDERAKDHADWRPWFKPDGSSPVQPDTAHYPALSFLPAMVTNDPYYRGELQKAAIYHNCGGPPDWDAGEGYLYPWQQRQVAWGIRDAAAAFIATPEGDVPAPLLPKAYFRQMVLDNIDFLTDRYVNKGNALVQEMGFLGCDDLRYVAPWQQDYLSSSLGWIVWTGRIPEMRPLYDFQVRQAVKRATGPLRSQCIQYDFTAGAGDTWAETLEKNGRGPTPDGHLDRSIVGGVPHYIGNLRMALRIAVLNKVEGAEEAFSYIDDEAKRFGYLVLRHAVA